MALVVVSGTSWRQRIDGSSDGGAAIGIRSDDWFGHLIIIMQKINAPQKCSAQVLPGALIFAPGSTFLLPGALFCSGALYFAGITLPLSQHSQFHGR